MIHQVGISFELSYKAVKMSCFYALGYGMPDGAVELPSWGTLPTPLQKVSRLFSREISLLGGFIDFTSLLGLVQEWITNFSI